MTNCAAVNIVEHMALWGYNWESFDYRPTRGTAESWGRLVPNFLRNHHTDFQSVCTSLHSHQQWRSVPFSCHPLQHKLYLVFLILAFPTSVRWNLKVILICISLKAKDVKHFLKCLSVIFLDFLTERVGAELDLPDFLWDLERYGECRWHRPPPWPPGEIHTELEVCRSRISFYCIMQELIQVWERGWESWDGLRWSKE